MIHSKSAVNRAGDHLREWSTSGLDVPPPVDALTVVEDFRAGFIGPTLSATKSLRTIVSETTESQVFVSNRMKRLPQIIRKLVRMRNTSLARMEDIGGCRAVLVGGQAELRCVEALVGDDLEVVRVRDYVGKPKESGYRAVHLIARIEDHLIEIQLRTLGQQDWSSAVERTGGKLGWDLKAGDCEQPVLDYFSEVARAISVIESLPPGAPVGEYVSRLSAVRDRITPPLPPRFSR